MKQQMKTKWEIEYEWDVAKLLITNIDYKLLLFRLPQYGLYVEKISPIPVVYPKTSHCLGFHLQVGDPGQSHIVSIKSEDASRIADFIRECPEFRAHRIFKHGMNFRGLAKENVIGLVCETVKNMLHLYPGKTFCIASKDKKLRQLFYEKAVQINEEDDLGCSFDYDEYDYTLEIRTCKRFKDGVFHRWAVITILYGDDLPNSWRETILQDVADDIEVG